MNRTRVATLLLVGLAVFQAEALAWSEGGHRVIAVMAFELLEPDKQQQVLKILQSHPRYAEDFSPPAGVANQDHWIIGTAGYWPDTARRFPQWNRPNWHYELGAALTLGDVADVPMAPGPLPESATLETQDLHAAQAIELCRRVLADESEPDSAKALAIAWLCHLVADSHQPCHAGSLYAEHVFPTGDKGANDILLTRGRNLHALWDGLLGRRYDEGDIARRIREISGDAELLMEAGFGLTKIETLDQQTWLEESRELARQYVYAPEVREPISVLIRSRGGELPSLTLSDEYLKNAGRVARLRAAQAAFRLARILQLELVN